MPYPDRPDPTPQSRGECGERRGGGGGPRAVGGVLPWQIPGAQGACLSQADAMRNQIPSLETPDARSLSSELVAQFERHKALSENLNGAPPTTAYGAGRPAP